MTKDKLVCFLSPKFSPAFHLIFNLRGCFCLFCVKSSIAIKQTLLDKFATLIFICEYNKVRNLCIESIFNVYSTRCVMMKLQYSFGCYRLKKEFLISEAVYSIQHPPEYWQILTSLTILHLALWLQILGWERSRDWSEYILCSLYRQKVSYRA